MLLYGVLCYAMLCYAMLCCLRNDVLHYTYTYADADGHADGIG
jgi:hypothetical protein